MNKQKNLQKIFDKEYNLVKKQNLKIFFKKIKADKGIAIPAKVFSAKSDVLAIINQYRSISFTNDLLDFYGRERTNFNSVKFFLQYKFEQIQSNYYNLFKTPHIEYELTSEGITKLIAKDFALRILNLNLDEIKFEEDETAVTCFNKLILNYRFEDTLPKLSIFRQTPNKPETNKKEIDDLNLNFYNMECFLLFHYLVKNYQKSGKVKYINIYYFLKKVAKEKTDIYRFRMRIERDYKPMIMELFQVKITKFKTADIAYEESELPKLRDLEIKFRNETKYT